MHQTPALAFPYSDTNIPVDDADKEATVTRINRARPSQYFDTLHSPASLSFTLPRPNILNSRSPCPPLAECPPPAEASTPRWGTPQARRWTNLFFSDGSRSASFLRLRNLASTT
ncbi:uncharacterized protein PHACADRAFT_262268 [Phanerochaete carnosa HHB-10118-sp]|uniref:Uncharacterized protein n=1 Tax=Phanerochaete carnosa (strain HHB-10118-sp) TaxID=650164 RepID=K5VYK1_PHACS|nr:uncharacterized protein PHACADRAFT_262268 [Phanerochaete carnosa HHB-10118-sp]EKM51875.1 hypothetical protein PHACADRAFT_262268 [Phanerochaete carnosa HHB-10118-sp]